MSWRPPPWSGDSGDSRDAGGEQAEPDVSKLDFSRHFLASSDDGPSPAEVDRLFPPIDVVRPKWWVGPRLLLLIPVLGYAVPKSLELLFNNTIGTVALVPALLFCAFVLPTAVRQTFAGLTDLGFFWSVYGWRPSEPEPWLRDHAWGDLGETRSALGRIWALHRKVTLGGILACAAVILCFGPLAWIPVAIAVTFALVRGFLLATSGASRITYLERPYRVGEPITVRFGLEEGATIFWKARYLLACYSERPHPEGTSTPFGFARRQLYREVATVPEDHVPEAGSDIDIPFEPPDRLPATKLRQRYRVYWEFRVVADTESGAFDERFMVPVY